MSNLEIEELIIIEQHPIIREQLELISAEIDAKLSIVDGLVVSEESLKEVKKIRAEFNKDFAELEEQRKAVKKAVTDPYTQFESVYKEYVSDKFNAADKTLKGKISTVEDELREKKMQKVRAYFEEYAELQGVSEYACFLAQMNDLRTSYSMNEFKRIARERIDPLVSGLEAIKAQPEELQAEIMAEFKKLRKATVAITTVAERHKAIEEQKKAAVEQLERKAAEDEAARKVAQAAPEALAPPTAAPIPKAVDDDPVLKVTFTVTGKRSKLRELKQYLEDGGYQYE
jgi:hypothetical protein